MPSIFRRLQPKEVSLPGILETDLRLSWVSQMSQVQLHPDRGVVFRWSPSGRIVVIAYLGRLVILTQHRRCGHSYRKRAAFPRLTKQVGAKVRGFYFAYLTISLED